MASQFEAARPARTDSVEDPHRFPEGLPAKAVRWGHIKESQAMSRFAPALLVCLLAGTAIQADDAFPALDQRLGRTITVVEKNQPTEKAIITHVWRLDDGTPCMQAQGVTSKMQMTLVENVKAKSAVERIKIHRWVNGVRPVGCPLPPAVQTPVEAVKQTQYETPRTVVTTPRADKVAATEGGLLPVIPKKEEAVTAPAKVVQPPAPAITRTLPSVNTVPPVRTLPSTTEVAPLPPVTPPANVVARQPVSVPAVIKTVPAPRVETQAAPATPAPAKVETTTTKPELVGGCEVISVTENGVSRKYKVLGTARDKHGVMTYRCQALDNNEIVTLNCDACTTCSKEPACKPVCPPAPVKCEPAKVVCAPAPCKTETKPCEPAKPCLKEAVKPCDPCTTAKACEPCATAKACDPCANAKAYEPCKNHACGDCKDLGRCGNDCGLHCKRESLFDQSSHGHHGRDSRHWGSINVPVPGVRLTTVNGVPGGPPPQPLIPAFCTMNSSSVRAYMCAPQLVPMACLYRPFGDCMNSQITAGIYQANGVNGDAVANTLHLINVLAQSNEWENRQWAAQRLQQATMPTVRPYVEDALLAAAQTDRAPMVKVAAIRTLAGMNSTRPDVVTMLSYAAVDADPRIKEAASEALTSLAKSHGVQQAGYTK